MHRAMGYGLIGIALAALLVSAPTVEAQAPPPVRVSWVSIERAGAPSPFLDAFRRGMGELGYVEGRNLTIDKWWGEGSEERLSRQIDAIVRSRPAVIVAQGGLALQPLMVAHVATPIVFATVGRRSRIRET